MPIGSWRVELRARLEGLGGYSEDELTALEGAVESHIEAAYKRGLQAGRSQAGYSTRRKSKEEPCPSATGAFGSTASAGEP